MTDDRVGPAEAVRTSYVAHAVAIHGYAARRVGRDLADDIVADTFRHAIESWESFDETRGSERAWLYGIATNLLRRHWRTEQRRLNTLDRVAGTRDLRIGGDPLLVVPGRLDAGDDARRVVEAVDRLSPDDHELLVLAAWEQMSSGDIAVVLGIPSGTVRSRLHRIRRQLDQTRTGDDS